MKDENAPPPLPVTFYIRKALAAKGLLASIAFTLLGYLAYVDPRAEFAEHDRIAGILGMGFFGLAGLALLYLLIREPKALFAFTSDGICDGAGKVLAGWRNIADVRLVTVRKQPFIGIFLKDPQKYYATLTKPQAASVRVLEKMIGTPYILNPRLTGKKPELLVEWIKSYIQRKALP